MAEHAKLQNGPVLVKDMVVAHAGKNLKNGKDTFDLTTEALDRMVRNFAEQQRQVPVYLGGEHFEDRADRLADGWVSALRRDGDDLVAEVKLHGVAAVAVNDDLVRGISIGTVLGKDVHGKTIGDVLDHLLITNQPFFTDLNIAASDQQAGDEGRVVYLTACSTKEDTPMAKSATALKKAALAEHPEDEENKLEEHPEDHRPDLQDEDEDELAEHPDDEFPEEEFTRANFKRLKKLLRKLNRKMLGLEAEKETLDEHLKAKRGLMTEDKQKLALRVKRLETERDAQTIREVVREGLERLTLKGAWVKGYKGEETDGGLGTLDWLKTSRFADVMNPLDIKSALRTLKYQVFKGTPIAKLDQEYPAGQQPGTTALSSDDHETLRTLGMDEEQFRALNKKDGGRAYRALVAKRSGKE